MTNWDQVFQEFREESNKDKTQPTENEEGKRPKEDF